jgi:hypothetical protein
MPDEKKPLPVDFQKKLKEILVDLEDDEIKNIIDADDLKIEIKDGKALWYVAYKTAM